MKYILMIGIFCILILSILNVNALSFSGTNLTNGLVSYYNLDESSGVVIDSAGLVNGTNQGATAGVPGKLNTAYNNFRINQMIIFSNTTNMYMSSPITISAWINLTAYSFNDPIYAGEINGIVFHVSSNGGNAISFQKEGGAGVNDFVNFTLSQWHMLSVSYNGTDAMFYVDGILNATKPFADPSWSKVNMYIGYENGGTKYSSNQSTIDEVGIWNRSLNSSEMLQLYNLYNSTSSGSTFSNAGTHSCYQESANVPNQDSNDGNCGLNYSGNYAENLTSHDIYINYSKPSSIIGNNILWEVLDGQSDNITNLTIPSQCWNYKPNLLSLKINSTTSFPLIFTSSSCYNGTSWIILRNYSEDSNGLGICQGCSVGSSLFDGNWNSGSFFRFEGINNWYNDNIFSGFREEAIIWDGYNLYENSQTFNSTTNELTNENFIENITYDSKDYTLSANFTYNNTVYPSTILNYESYQLLINNITIPIVSTSGTTKTFYWTIALTNSTGTYAYNSTINQQTINKGTNLILNNSCPTGTSPAFNFTSFWEANLTAINMSTVNYNILYGLVGNANAYTLNGSLTNVNQFSICLNNSQPYYNIGYGEIDYSVTGASNRRYYIFSGTRATNITTSISLYALETAISTPFQITVQSSSLNPYVNYYVSLMRWYPNLNSYNVVEIGKTDNTGNTVVNVKTQDVSYKLGVYDSNGNLVYLSNQIQMMCLTTPCTYSLYIDSNPLDLTKYTNIQNNLSYDSNLKKFTFIWNDPSQSSQTMNLTIYQINGLNNVIICSTTASGYIGILTCNVNAYSGTLKAEVIRTASPSVIFNQLIVQIRQTIIDVGGGTIGLFIGFILLVLFAMIGVFISPVLVIILGVVALIPMVLLGSIPLMVLTAIGVIAGVVLHFLKRVS